MDVIDLHWVAEIKRVGPPAGTCDQPWGFWLKLHVVASGRAHWNYFSNPCICQWDSFPLIFLRETACLLPSVEETIIKYFASHSLEAHCSFQPLILLQWKFKTHFLWSTATQTLGTLWGISQYHGTIFFSLFIPLCMDLCLRSLCLHVGIHDCRICVYHRPQGVVKTTWKNAWVLHSGGDASWLWTEGRQPTSGSGMKQNAPTQLARCCPSSLGPLSQTNMLNALDNQGSCIPTSAN